MPEQPRRRETMGDLYAKFWPDATPELLAQLYAEFGDPDQEVYSFAEMMRSLGLDNEK